MSYPSVPNVNFRVVINCTPTNEDFVALMGPHGGIMYTVLYV